jgi:hypothetical protein
MGQLGETRSFIELDLGLMVGDYYDYVMNYDGDNGLSNGN